MAKKKPPAFIAEKIADAKDKKSGKGKAASGKKAGGKMKGKVC